MKKIVACLLFFALLVLYPVFAESSDSKRVEICFCIGDETLTINGESFTSEKPYVVGAGHTLVPVRVISEAFGARVGWSEIEKRVTLLYGDTTISLEIGKTDAVINSEGVILDCAPELSAGGFTMVPLRFISENFGAEVSYEPTTREVTVVREEGTGMQNEPLQNGDDRGNPLANTYRALTYDKQLTVGYIGGSITFGNSAATSVRDDDGNTVPGDIMLSWVNRTDSYLRESFPDAKIECVNAGVSDTATNYAVYRLGKELMNTDGHGMPDLVFIEFTTNDWFYNDLSGKQDYSDVKRQAESLINTIYEYNPYADIVFMFSIREEENLSRKAYIELSEKYGIPYIDGGLAVQRKMNERGIPSETKRNCYYTVDNIHPSSVGYGIYFEEIKKLLDGSLVDINLDAEKTNRKAKADEIKTGELWTKPTILPVSALNITGDGYTWTKAYGNYMYGTDKDSYREIPITPDSLKITSSDTKISFEFEGTTFSALLHMNTSGFDMYYTVDGKEKRMYIHKGAFLDFQRYEHTQLFVVEQELDYGKHKVEITFGEIGFRPPNVTLCGVAFAGGK